jgi:hypothetical protein
MYFNKLKREGASRGWKGVEGDRQKNGEKYA